MPFPLFQNKLTSFWLVSSSLSACQTALESGTLILLLGSNHPNSAKYTSFDSAGDYNTTCGEERLGSKW